MTNPLLDSPLVQSIGWALIHFIWQGTLIGAATALALYTIDRQKAERRYLVACAGLMSMLLAPPLFAFMNQPADIELGSIASLPPAVVAPIPIDRIPPVAVTIWIVGVALLSLRLIAACIGIERMKRVTREVDDAVWIRLGALAQRLGVNRAVRVVASHMVRVPTVVGWLRPVILLPVSVVTGLPAAHLDAVLAHELAHVRRHDYLVNALQSIVETLLFYHPVVWWCSRQIRIEREHCCDDLVVLACGDRIGYATALAQLEELRGLEPMLSLNVTGGRLIDRVRRVLGHEPANDRRLTAWMIVVSLTVVVTAVIVTSVLALANAEVAQVTNGRDVTLQEPSQPRDVPELANDQDALVGAATLEDEYRRATEEALKNLAEETGGLPRLSQITEPRAPLPPLVPLPPVPAAPGALPAVPTSPAAPAVPAIPTSPAPPAVPAVPTLPEPPEPGEPQAAPPAPPTAPEPPEPPAPPVEIGQIDLAREMRLVHERLASSFDDLRRATEMVNAKQEALLQAQADVARMRLEVLASDAQIQAIQKSIAELTAAMTSARLGQLNEEVLRKQLKGLEEQIDKLRAR